MKVWAGNEYRSHQYYDYSAEYTRLNRTDYVGMNHFRLCFVDASLFLSLFVDEVTCRYTCGDFNRLSDLKTIQR